MKVPRGALLATTIFLLPPVIVCGIVLFGSPKWRIDLDLSGGARVTYAVRESWWESLTEAERSSFDLDLVAVQLRRRINGLASEGLVNFSDSSVAVVRPVGRPPTIQVLVPAKSNVQQVLAEIVNPVDVTFHLVEGASVRPDADHSMPYTCGYLIPQNESDGEATAQAVAAAWYESRLRSQQASLMRDALELIRAHEEHASQLRKEGNSALSSKANRPDVRNRVQEEIKSLSDSIDSAYTEALEITEQRLHSLEALIQNHAWETSKEPRNFRELSERYSFLETRTSPQQEAVVIWLSLGRPYLTQGSFDLDGVKIKADEDNEDLYALTMPMKLKQTLDTFFDDGYGRLAAVIVDGKATELPGVGSGRFKQLEILSDRGGSHPNVVRWTVGDREEANIYHKFLRSERLDVPLDLLQLEAVDPTVTPVQRVQLMHAGLLAVLTVLLLMNLLFGRYPVFYILYILNMLFVLGVYLLFILFGLLTFNLAMIGAIVLALGMSVDPLILLFDDVTGEIGEQPTSARDTLALLRYAFKSEVWVVSMASLTTIVALFWLFYFGGNLAQFAIAVMLGCLLNVCSLGLAYLFMNDPLIAGMIGSVRMAGLDIARVFHWVSWLHRPFARKVYIGLGVAALALSVLLYFGFGRGRPGLWYSGGTSLVIRSETPVPIDHALGLLRDYFNESVNLQRLGHSGQRFLIATTSVIAGTDSEVDQTFEVEDLVNHLTSGLGVGIEVEAAGSLSPMKAATVGEFGTYLLMLCIFLVFAALYLRYTSIVKGIAIWMVLALVFDLAVAFLVAQTLEPAIPLALLAGVAAVAGYSANDSVVICERMYQLAKEKPVPYYAELVDRMVPRVLGTSLTTILPLVLLSALVDGILRQLAIVLSVGIFAGTLSSIALVAGNFRQTDEEVQERVKRYMRDRCLKLIDRVSSFAVAPQPEKMTNLQQEVNEFLAGYDDLYRDMYCSGTGTTKTDAEAVRLGECEVVKDDLRKKTSPEFLTAHFSAPLLAASPTYAELVRAFHGDASLAESGELIRVAKETFDSTRESLREKLAEFGCQPAGKWNFPDDLAKAVGNASQRIEKQCAELRRNLRNQSDAQLVAKASHFHRDILAFEEMSLGLARETEGAFTIPDEVSAARADLQLKLGMALGPECYVQANGYAALLKLCDSRPTRLESIRHGLLGLRGQALERLSDRLGEIGVPAIGAQCHSPPELRQALHGFCRAHVRDDATLGRTIQQITDLGSLAAPTWFSGSRGGLDALKKEAVELIKKKFKALEPEFDVDAEALLEEVTRSS